MTGADQEPVWIPRSTKVRRWQAERVERGRRDPSAIPHGTPGGYTNWGCRCDACRRARYPKGQA